MGDLSQYTLEAITELESNPQIVNLRNTIEQEFESWTQTLFPMLQDRKIPCYPFAVKLLHKAGYDFATVDLVRNCMARIRAKRGLRSNTTAGVTLTVTPPAPAIVSTSQKVQLATSKALAPAPPNQVVVTPHIEAVPGVAPVEVTDWMVEYLRLKREVDYSPWTSQDEWMWQFLEDFAKTNRLQLWSNFPDVERLLDPIKVQCFTKLRRKRPK